MARPDEIEPEDEEAFRWAGDEVVGREGARLPSTTPDPVDDPADLAPLASRSGTHPAATLVSILFALLYLAVTVGWIIGTGYTSAGSAQLLPQVLWQFGEFTAIMSAPLWFAGSLVLTRSSRLPVRVAWLALGLGVLLPWPVFPLLAVS